MYLKMPFVKVRSLFEIYATFNSHTNEKGTIKAY